MARRRERGDQIQNMQREERRDLPKKTPNQQCAPTKRAYIASKTTHQQQLEPRDRVLLLRARARLAQARAPHAHTPTSSRIRIRLPEPTALLPAQQGTLHALPERLRHGRRRRIAPRHRAGAHLHGHNRRHRGGDRVRPAARHRHRADFLDSADLYGEEGRRQRCPRRVRAKRRVGRKEGRKNKDRVRASRCRRRKYVPDAEGKKSKIKMGLTRQRAQQRPTEEQGSPVQFLLRFRFRLRRAPSPVLYRAIPLAHSSTALPGGPDPKRAPTRNSQPKAKSKNRPVHPRTQMRTNKNKKRCKGQIKRPTDRAPKGKIRPIHSTECTAQLNAPHHR